MKDKPPETRTKAKQLRFKPSELEWLRKQADAKGLDVASYIRLKCLEGYK